VSFQPPLHCHHSGSFRTPASSLDRSCHPPALLASRSIPSTTTPHPTCRAAKSLHRPGRGITTRWHDTRGGASSVTHTNTYAHRHSSAIPPPTRTTLMPTATPPPQYAPLPAKASYAACASRRTHIWASRSLPSSSASGRARCVRITRRRSTAIECTTAAGRDGGDSSMPDGSDRSRLLALAFTQRYHAAPALSTPPSAAQGRFLFPSHYRIRRRKRSQASGMSSAGGPPQF
jgi:hypothetical protein